MAVRSVRPCATMPTTTLTTRDEFRGRKLGDSEQGEDAFRDAGHRVGAVFDQVVSMEEFFGGHAERGARGEELGHVRRAHEAVFAPVDAGNEPGVQLVDQPV